MGMGGVLDASIITKQNNSGNAISCRPSPFDFLLAGRDILPTWTSSGQQNPGVQTGDALLQIKPYQISLKVPCHFPANCA
jgi:hypothetical protein